MYWRFLISACFWFSIVWLCNGRSTAAEPGYLDFDNLPDTNFSCDGKVIGGYYADTETGCQMFHVCTIGQKGEITDIKFLCLNGTVFDQETRVCERVDEVDCSKTESFFDLNLELYGNSAAGFGVPEEEGEESEDLKECDSNNDNCQTDAPHSKQQSSQQRGQGKDSVEEELYEGERETDEISTQKIVTLPPPTTTTTTRQPITSTLPRLQSTTPTPPQILQYPTTSPETIAALLALHNAFTASLQQHGDPQKTRPNPPRITGYLPTSSTVEFQNQNRPLARPTQFSTREQPHHFSVQKQHYNSQGTKPPGGLRSQNPTSSENYNNMNFHHSFHISNQGSHFPRQSYDDEYPDIESHPSTSSIPRTKRPKPFNFDNYEGEEYYRDDKLQSTPNPFILSPLKINRLNDNQDDSKTVLNRGNFIRDLHNQNNNFQTLSFRRQTTPSVSIVTSTSTTSSSSVRSGKPNQSAILTRKPQTENKHFIHPSSTGDFIPPTVQPKINSTVHLSVESYDDYQESDVHSDPFFKDVPKISRTRRYIKDTRSYSKLDILSQFLCSKNISNIINGNIKVCNLEGYSEILKNWIEIPKNSTIIAIKIEQPLRHNPKLPLYFSQTSALNVHSIDGNDNGDSIHYNTIKQKNSSFLRNEVNRLISQKLKNHRITNDEEQKNSINNKSIKVLIKRSPLEESDEEVKTYSSRKRQITNQRTRNQPPTQSGRKYRVDTQTEIKLPNSQSEEIIVPQQRSSGRRRSEHRNIGRESSIAQDYLDTSQSAAEVSRRRQTNTKPNKRKLVLQPATVPNRSSVETYTQTLESDSGILQQQQQSPTIQFSSARRKHIHNDDYDTVPPSSRRKTSTIQSTAAPITPLRRPSTIQASDNSRTNTFVQKQATQDSNFESEQQGTHKRKPNASEIPTNETIIIQSNLKANTQFSCEGKVKGGYYADVEADCKGFFICTQGKIGDPLLNTHFWCGTGTKFNQRSRTCQAENRVYCSLSSRYYHLNNDFLAPELDEEFQDSFEPLKI